MLKVVILILSLEVIAAQTVVIDRNLFPTSEEMIIAANMSNSVYIAEDILSYYKGTYYYGPRCFVGQVGDTLWIVYRGTWNQLDIFTDITIEKVEPFGSGNGKIHKGFFYRSSQEFGISIDEKGKPKENSILDLIEKSNAKNIIFTGHSLGGSTCVLSYLRYINYCENNICKYKDKSKVISFAAPVCTTEEIRQRYLDYTNNIHCFEQWDDPVPGIVRLAEIFGLKPNNSINLMNNNKIVIDKSSKQYNASKAVSIPIGVHHIWDKNKNIVVPNNIYSIITYIAVSSDLALGSHSMNKYQCLVETEYNGFEGECGADSAFVANICGYMFLILLLSMISL